MSVDNTALVEQYLRYYNEKNVDAMMELFADEVAFESVSNTSGVTRTNGKEELRQLAGMSAEWFEQRRQRPLAWVVDDAHVAVEIEYWCRLAKDLPDGRKKAGEEMALRGASFFTVRDGHISRLVDYM
jgi:ketosteroid isomerase-like protein